MRRIAVGIELDGWPVQSTTRLEGVGAHVVVVTTAITSPRAPITLTSTYVGARGVDTHLTRLVQAPAGVSVERHEAPSISVVDDDRSGCVADHLAALRALLIELGFQPSIGPGTPRRLPDPLPQSVFFIEARRPERRSRRSLRA